MPKAKLPFKDFPWSPNLSYVVGLLVTDGNLSKDGRHISLRSSDLDLLNTFKLCLNLDNKIGTSYSNGFTKKPSYIVQFGSVQLYKWLIKIGLTPAKTHTISKIDLSDNYFRDFLRGHLDGDGTILTYTDKYNAYKDRRYTNLRVYLKFISVSEDHIKWLKNKIQELTPFKGSLTKTIMKNPKRVPMWTIKFSKKESIELLQWIYYKTDLPSLNRKRLLAEQILEQVKSEKKKKYEKVVTSI